MSAALEVRLLGDFTLLQDGRVVDTLHTPRLQALLAYLLLRRGAAQQRQHLAFLFWTDTSEAQARTNLRNLLHRLRQSWPQAADYLVIDNRTIGWLPGASIRLDVAEFEEHLQAAALTGDPTATLASLKQAVDLYQRDLLIGFYDEWVDAERARLRQAYLSALEQCADLLEEQADLKGSIHFGRRLLQADPLREAAYRRLMRLHAQDGDRAAALGVYYRCVSTLQRELEVEPDTATQAEYLRLLAVDVPGAETPLPVALTESSLVGRSREWEQLAQGWRQVKEGKRPPLVVLIRGEAGVGKSALAGRFTAWVERQGATTASAACYTPESDLSLVPVVSWLRGLSLRGLQPAWRLELARLLPELAGEQDGSPAQQANLEAPAEPWQKRRFYEALARAVLSQKQPVCLRLEDIQWSDSETLDWLHYLLRVDPRARLMLIVTLRQEETGEGHPALTMLSAWRQQGWLTEIDLDPLDPADTAALAAGLLAEEVPNALAAVLYHHTEGNPLFIVETIRSLLDRGKKTGFSALVTGLAELDSGGLPPKIQAVLHGRLEQLSLPAQELVGVAAVIGRSFDLGLLLQASDRGEDEWVRALDELWRRRIVRERDGEGYDFSHDKLRQAAYFALSPVRRRWLHGRVAQALESMVDQHAENQAALLAFHFEAAGQAQKAFGYHQQAALAARGRYAYQEAIFHLKAAIALLERLAAERDRAAGLHEQLGDVHTVLGQHGEASQAYQAAREASTPDEPVARAGLTRKMAQACVYQYELTAAWDLIDHVLDSLGEGSAFTRDHWRVWLDARLCQLDVLYYQANVERMAVLADEIQPAFEQHGSLQQRIEFYHMRVQLQSRRSRFYHTREDIAGRRKALQLAQETGDEILIQRSRFGLGFVLLWAGEIQPAIAELSETAATSQAAGNIPLLDRCLAYLSIAQRMRGQADQVQSSLERSLAVAESEENELYIGVARANQAWLCWRAGDLDQAAAHARSALEKWQRLVFPFHWLACWPYLAVCLAKGNLETAIGLARAMLAVEQQRQPDEIEAALSAAVDCYPDNAIQSGAYLQRALQAAQQHRQI